MNGSPPAPRIAVSVQGVTKRFDGALALDDVSVDLYHGEVHALVGENGAGKSTLARIIAGIYLPDRGIVQVDGKTREFDGPYAAQQAGIAMVHQELNVIGTLSVAENVLMGVEPATAGWIRQSDLIATTRRYLDTIGLDVDPRAPAEELSIAQQQLVEIARVLALDAQVIIMDEPTSSLSTVDAAHLLDLVRSLREQGKTILLISHHLAEITAVADRVTVLRDGQLIATEPAAGLDESSLIRMIVGRDIERVYHTAGSAQSKEPLLTVENLVAPGVRSASLSVHRGEILGVGGLVGSGRTELLLALFGAAPIQAGTLTLRGKPFRPKSPHDAIKAGLALVPESRKDDGLVLEASVEQNIELASLAAVSLAGWIVRSRSRSLAASYVDRLLIKTASIGTPVSSLSGGNQQKVVLAKNLATDPEILLLDEPTRGVDIGAKAEIHAIMRDLAATGRAIIMVTSVLPELLLGSDRIVVMRNGRTVGELEARHADEESLTRLAFAG
jgi:ribose transport system ATP-binding protein